MATTTRTTPRDTSIFISGADVVLVEEFPEVPEFLFACLRVFRLHEVDARSHIIGIWIVVIVIAEQTRFELAERVGLNHV
jgi:hypothetical protein